MIKHVIWDFDGTLYNTYPKIAEILQQTLREFSVEEVRSDILKNLHVSMSFTLTHYADKHQLDHQLLRKHFIENEENMDVTQCQPFEGMESIIARIHQNSGKNFIYTNRGNSTFRFLEAQHHTTLFEEIITRDSGMGKKPSPHPILYLIDKYGLDKSETLMIGDRDIDIQAAKLAGIPGCYFNSHGMDSQENPEYHIESLLQLAHIL